MKTYHIEVKTKSFENIVETIVEIRRGNNVTPRRGKDVPQRPHWVFYLVTEDVV